MKKISSDTGRLGAISHQNQFRKSSTQLHENTVTHHFKAEFSVSENNLSLLIEEKLVQIWQEMLGIDNVQANDNFFDLGGHSILAMKGLTRIRENFEIEMTFKDFMTSPTIAAQREIVKARMGSYNSLSQLFENTKVDTSFHNNKSSQTRAPKQRAIQPGVKNSDTTGSVKNIVHSEGMVKLPLTPSQKRLWYLCKLNSKSPAYNIPITLKLTGKLDIQVLHKTIELIFNQQNIVHANFYSEEGVPFITINKNQNVVVQEYDLAMLSKRELEDKYNEIISYDSRLPFNLEKEPLFRLLLIKIDQLEWLFHLTIHHLVFDGISWGIFVNEFNNVYNQLIKNEKVDLETIVFHQYDYAKWLQNHPAKQNSDSIEFWKKYLDGIPDYTNFPLDRSRRTISSGKGAKLQIKIPSDLTQKIRRYSKSQNTTVYTTMLSVFGLLIKRFCNESDFCIGTHIASRPQASLEKIFGMFVDTFPLRFKFDGISTFEELVTFTKSGMLDVFENRVTDFDKIVETINPKRSILYNSIFQIAFVWPNELSATIRTENLTGKRFYIKDGVSPFDITFYMWENNGEIEGEIEYNIDLFNESTISSLQESYVVLLDSILDNIQENFNRLNVVSDTQYNQLIQFTNSRTDYPRESVLSLLKKIGDKFPNKPALSFNGEKVSYFELDKKSNQLALELVQNGVKEGEPIAIYLNKSNELIVSIIAILKVKCYYLPLDTEYPKQRVIDIMADAGSNYLITTENLERTLSGSYKKILINDSIWQKNATSFSNNSDQEDIAYIMYTSGTTGVPKGSLIKHKSIVRLVRNTNYIQIQESDNILLTGSIGFDASTFEIWGALLNGCTLFIVGKEILLDPQELEKHIKTNNISILWLTSSLFTQMAELNIHVFANLRCLLVGGDVLSVEHIKRVRHQFTDLTIVNGYGPTENTTFSACHIIENDYQDNIPIGKPISNSTAYIFNEFMKLQPIGAIGELYVGGDGLSAGYLNRPKLNSEKFVINPLNNSESLYKTGDKARWLENGVLEFHGRIDSQLKIRGFRVEPLEVEAQINKIPGVVEAVIKPFERTDGNIELYAFVSIKENFKITRETITSYLMNVLPAYMIPNMYDFRIGFPKTINGKIDRSSLKFRDEIFESLYDSNEQRMNDIERRVFVIFSEVLKHENFKVESNFFDIGGNSLLSIKVISQIEKRFHVNLKVRDFIADLNSVQKVSAYISKRGTEDKQVNRKFQKLDETFEHLYRIQSYGNEIPVFSIYCDPVFSEKDLFKSRTVYDFIWPGSDGKPITISSVEEVAQIYLDELQRINPKGPYYILGFSFGGLVAYEIALRLQKSGYKVPILMMIDSANPQFWESPKMSQIVKSKIRKHGIIKALTIRLFNALKGNIKLLLIRLEIFLHFILNKKLPARIRGTMIYDNVIRIASKYRPGYYDGKVNIFKSKVGSVENKYLGWHSLVSDITYFELEGSHEESIRQPNNKISIIRELERMIKKVEST